ncbi:hypothetical protein [Actinoplanes rectilineatus]|uniref:hypothetical protein n=1 Tax=Actinoplanes rectilineatus TaxID=113571 RepID=UPI0005F2E20F|nr:hypothetical protein [Actinoplanes rectilineatus]
MRSRQISAPCCLGIIESASHLSMCSRISWTVARSSDGLTVPALARALTDRRRHDRVFSLPPEAGEWFRLSFAIDGARHALAFQYVWAVSVAARQPGSPTPVDFLLWRLRLTMPRECARDLQRLRRALSVADRHLS